MYAPSIQRVSQWANQLLRGMQFDLIGWAEKWDRCYKNWDYFIGWTCQLNPLAHEVITIDQLLFVE